MHPRTRLILSGAAIALIWQLPYGRQLLYPLSLLATYAHEMGHGLTALASGASFDRLLLHADGSGLAVWHGQPGPLAGALVAAGGLLGPTAAGMGLLLLSRSPVPARAVLAMLGALIAVSVLLWVRNGFGVAFLLALAAALAVAARMLSEGLAAWLLHGLALTLCLSWFSDLAYMFSAQALVNGAGQRSDSAAIAEALGGPYWFWGGLLAVLSMAVALLGIVWVSRGHDVR